MALVQNGADPHLMGTEGLNALHLSIQFKHADIIIFLCASNPALLDAPLVRLGSTHVLSFDPLISLVFARRCVFPGG